MLICRSPDEPPAFSQPSADGLRGESGVIEVNFTLSSARTILQETSVAPTQPLKAACAGGSACSRLLHGFRRVGSAWGELGVKRG